MIIFQNYSLILTLLSGNDRSEFLNSTKITYGVGKWPCDDA